ncbi:hypothetical protein [Paenibacillus cymbidii]|uniref:hypothetical protein n=1 Tax=Paenibacillus cymbidii TaxID=1639034 RepID=UPI0010813FF0|nr:hypothetical protein [Paenibacillus cymbidii]
MQSVGAKIQTIRSVTIVSNPCFIFALGAEHNGRIVAEIIDCGCEWESGLDFIYKVFDAQGDLIVAVENCPVIVEYDAPLNETDYDVTPDYDEEKLPF